MNREIKFRVWNDIQEYMEHLDSLDLEDEPASNIHVMQYTGLKDKNGVEIYEGDVLKAKHKDGGYDIGEVVYGTRGAFCLHLPKVATGIKTPLLNYMDGIMFAEYDFEVIGNIHENPELLNKS